MYECVQILKSVEDLRISLAAFEDKPPGIDRAEPDAGNKPEVLNGSLRGRLEDLLRRAKIIVDCSLKLTLELVRGVAL